MSSLYPALFHAAKYLQSNQIAVFQKACSHFIGGFPNEILMLRACKPRSRHVTCGQQYGFVSAQPTCTSHNSNSQCLVEQNLTPNLSLALRSGSAKLMSTPICRAPSQPLNSTTMYEVYSTIRGDTHSICSTRSFYCIVSMKFRYRNGRY